MIDTTSINKSVNLIDLIGKYTHLHKCGPNEYSGPCVQCGGTDRMHVRPDGWFCRQCHNEHAWDDAIGFVMWYQAVDFQTACVRLGGRNLNATKDQLDRMAASRQKLEDERRVRELADMQRARRELQAGRAWEAYHRNLDAYPEGRRAWNVRGLSDYWMGVYQVGYCPDRAFMHDGDEIHSASLTIPYFRMIDDQMTCIGLRHRLLNENAPGGKYRPHLAGLGNHLYYTDPLTRKMMGDVLVVEGEVKAMVTWSIFWDDAEESIKPDLWVVGIPGKSWKPDYLADLAGADRVFVCLDPDARKEARRMVEQLGGRGRLLELPGKIDDLIICGALDVDALLGMMR